MQASRETIHFEISKIKNNDKGLFDQSFCCTLAAEKQVSIQNHIGI